MSEISPTDHASTIFAELIQLAELGLSISTAVFPPAAGVAAAIKIATLLAPAVEEAAEALYALVSGDEPSEDVIAATLARFREQGARVRDEAARIKAAAGE